MTIYWLLLAFPALMALFAPLREDNEPFGMSMVLGALFLGLAYVLISLMRYEVGGDWIAYQAMYDAVQDRPLGEALAVTDIGFSLLLILSAKLGTGIYLVNAFCSLVLIYGVLRIAMTTREPWLAVTAAVPYILIVVGLGYVRQGAAIGFILLAIAAVGRERPIKVFALLGLALAFHSTSIAVWPLFAWALANRNRLRVLLLSTVGAAGFLALVAWRYSNFAAGYIEQEYGSSGTLVRLLMSAVPSVILVLRYRYFVAPARSRAMWLWFAFANLAALASLAVVSSSTAVDRTSLYFACVQIIVFGQLSALLNLSPRMNLIVRVLVITYSIAVQSVWLIYATHADSWVPYQSILRYF